jgi:hypothetical protein
VFNFSFLVALPVQLESEKKLKLDQVRGGSAIKLKIPSAQENNNNNSNTEMDSPVCWNSYYSFAVFIFRMRWLWSLRRIE